MDKYLICRPEGGLTDMLSQLGRCFNYCLRHGRVLVIDTANSRTFSSPFERYFSFVHPELRVVTDPRGFIRRATAEGLSVHPPHAKIDPAGHASPRYVKLLNYCLDGIPLTFDFDCDHEAAVLIHQGCGRESFDLGFMGCLRLSPRLRGLVERRWASLPRPYVGVHVRHTDIKSEIGSVMPLVRRYRGAVFLATDAAEVQRRVRAVAGRRVFMSKIPDFRGAALHTKRVGPGRKGRINTSAIVDLLLLALSKRVYVTTEASGYSLLALELNRNPALVAAWLGRDLRALPQPWLRGFALARGTLEGLLACGPGSLRTFRRRRP